VYINVLRVRLELSLMGPVGLVFCNSDSCTFKRNLGANIGAFNYITASIQTYTYKK